jgi:hypothetical protein
MTASKSLPARPSLDSLRKQARKLARDIAAGDMRAIARAAAQVPEIELPLTLRNAQLVIAREYGYAGWQDLIAEVNRRVGRGVEWAAAQARRIIHDNDIETLKELLAEYPALLSWQGHDGGGVLGMATGAFGDSFDPNREQSFTRASCAEVLIDAGAVVTPSVYEGLIDSRARGLLQLFRRKGVLPRTLKFLASLGDVEAVRVSLDEREHDPAAINEAFLVACHFEQEAVASVLLARAIALDGDLDRRIAANGGRGAFIKQMVAKLPLDVGNATIVGPWKTFVMGQVTRAAQNGDQPAFELALQREPWLLGEAYLWFQARLIEVATLNDRGDCIHALLKLDPAILRRQPPPASQAIEFAVTYGHTHLIPILTRIWPVPDDLPHAAGMGDLARVMRWFDEHGVPALGDLRHHYPCNDPRARGHLHWDPPTLQHVLDTALAFAVINHHFDVADYLLQHGADINTDWNSHEPASILHHLVFEDDYDSMRFLIDRGIDMTIKDYRWRSTAQGWARYGKQDEKMAQWLDDAERQR